MNYLLIFAVSTGLFVAGSCAQWRCAEYNNRFLFSNSVREFASWTSYLAMGGIIFSLIMGVGGCVNDVNKQANSNETSNPVVTECYNTSITNTTTQEDSK